MCTSVPDSPCANCEHRKNPVGHCLRKRGNHYSIICPHLIKAFEDEGCSVYYSKKRHQEDPPAERHTSYRNADGELETIYYNYEAIDQDESLAVYPTYGLKAADSPKHDEILDGIKTRERILSHLFKSVFMRISDSETLPKAILSFLLENWGFRNEYGEEIPFLTETGHFSDGAIEHILNMEEIKEIHWALEDKPEYLFKGRDRHRSIINAFDRLKEILSDLLYLKNGYRVPVEERIGINDIYDIDLDTITDHRKRAAVYLHYRCNVSQEEIAEKMGINQSTISRWLKECIN